MITLDRLLDGLEVEVQHPLVVHEARTGATVFRYFKSGYGIRSWPAAP